jgi:hypothetical protein
MSIAMNGKNIARLCLLEDDLRVAFRFRLIETLLQKGFGVTEILNSKLGKKHRTKAPANHSTRNDFTSSTFSKQLTGFITELTPFWSRIFTTLNDLDMTVHRSWNEYTDDEILNLPYDLPGIARAKPYAQELANLLKEGLNTENHRHRFQNVAGFRSFRDILLFHNHTYGRLAHLRLPDKKAFFNHLTRIQLQKAIRFTDQERSDIIHEFNYFYTR